MMKKEIPKPGNKKDKHSFFELIIEILGWVQIAASPFLIGLVIGLIIYNYLPGLAGIIITLIIVLSGLIVGIIWASRIWKKKGTMHFLSRVMATPELDKQEEEDKL